MKTWLSMLSIFVIGTILGTTLAISQFPPVQKLLPDMEVKLRGQDAGPDAVVQGSTGAEAAAVSEEQKASTKQEEKQPRIKIDEEVHDFGVMEDSKKGHHEFLFENVGNAPLEIEVTSTTCKCTKGEVEKERIYPGEKTKMILEWDPKGYTGDFAQTATLTTNDPARPSISLKVKGRVHSPMALIPRTMLFGQITNRQDVDGTVRLYLFEDGDAKITDIELKNKKTESLFTLDLEKLTPEEIQAQPDAKAGYRINVTLKPGMSQGPIRQTAQIKTDSKTLGEIDLPIEGKVVGSISVYGAGWNENKNAFRLGIIDGRRGLKKHLTVVVRHLGGQSDPLHIASVTPSGILKASLSKPITGSSGKVTHAKLTIEIPPDTPATNYIGSKQAPFGHILLASERLDGPKLDLRISFVVENQ